MQSMKMANFKAYFVATIFLITSLNLHAEEKDLFPNLGNTPNLNNDGPVSLDTSDDEDVTPIPFTPIAPVGPSVGPIRGNNNNNRRPVFNSNNSRTRPNAANPPVTAITSEPAVNNAYIRAANVPSQYSCPLFENSSYQDLNIAISNLTTAIQGVSDYCQSSQPQVDSVKKTSEQIRQSILELQNYVSNPAMGYENSTQMQSQVTALISGIDRMSDAFKNVSSLQNSCGRKNLSWGKVALELNNVVNSASPFLLLLAATQPALSVAVKGAIMGTVVGSSAISTMSQMIENNTVKMENADQRNAVLQNTCQFTKVAKKISYIQLARSGRFQALEQQLNDNVNTYALKVAGGSPLLTSMWSVRGNMRNNISNLQAAVRSDKEAIEEVQLRIREAQNNALLVCIQGKQLVQMAQEDEAFPNSVQSRILEAYQQNNYLKNIDLTDFEAVYGSRALNQREGDQKLKVKVQTLIKTYQGLLNRIANYPEDPTGEALSACAATTMAFVQHMVHMISETSNIMVEDLNQMEEDLARNDEYRKWKSEFDKIVTEQENTNRMARVLKELTKSGAGVYNRSEFAEAAQNLKRSLFGPRKGFLGGESPVFAWLEYKNLQYAKSIGSFDKTIDDIVSKSFALTSSGSGGAAYGRATAAQNKKFTQDYESVRLMTILNKKTLPLNSPQWELACIDLEKAIKDYSDALDHLGTTHFMCDMIYDYLDNSVDPKIIEYCRGQSDYSGKQNDKQISSLEKANRKLNEKLASNVLSYQELANLIAKKMMEIDCRLPKVDEL